MKILIAGCGYLGKRLAEALLASGHEVWGLRRDVEHLEDLKEKGLQPLSGSLLNPGSLRQIPQVDLAVFCQAPSREGDNYPDTYLAGTKNLMFALQRKLPKKLIFISSTSVYGLRDGSWVDENDEPDAQGYSNAEGEEKAKALLDAERYILKNSVPGIVLRLGGIYGPGRHRLMALKQGKLKPDFSDHYVNRVHVDDAVAAIQLLIEKGKAGEIYLGVDNSPSTQKEFYEWVCEKMEISANAKTAAGAQEKTRTANKRCLNKKIKALGLKLRYPDYKKGYEPLVLETLGRKA